MAFAAHCEVRAALPRSRTGAVSDTFNGSDDAALCRCRAELFRDRALASSAGMYADDLAVFDLNECGVRRDGNLFGPLPRAPKGGQRQSQLGYHADCQSGM